MKGLAEDVKECAVIELTADVTECAVKGLAADVHNKEL